MSESNAVSPYRSSPLEVWTAAKQMSSTRHASRISRQGWRSCRRGTATRQGGAEIRRRHSCCFFPLHQNINSDHLGIGTCIYQWQLKIKMAYRLLSPRTSADSSPDLLKLAFSDHGASTFVREPCPHTSPKPFRYDRYQVRWAWYCQRLHLPRWRASNLGHSFRPAVETLDDSNARRSMGRWSTRWNKARVRLISASSSEK